MNNKAVTQSNLILILAPHENYHKYLHNFFFLLKNIRFLYLRMAILTLSWDSKINKSSFQSYDRNHSDKKFILNSGVSTFQFYF